MLIRKIETGARSSAEIGRSSAELSKQGEWSWLSSVLFGELTG